MVCVWTTSYRTNNIMLAFGSDFQFENANVNFKNMDKLMRYINAHPEYELNMFYSTPSIYIEVPPSTLIYHIVCKRHVSCVVWSTVLMVFGMCHHETVRAQGRRGE